MNRESRQEHSIEILREILRLITEKKGEETVVLDVEEASIGTDFFVITEANNPRQLRAIAENIKKGLPQEPLAFEGFDSSVWIALDYGNVIVHVFEREARRFYDLESLWGDKPLRLDGSPDRSASRSS
jgi:ribosome-associated protein